MPKITWTVKDKELDIKKARIIGLACVADKN
jgi:hypothetical protein